MLFTWASDSRLHCDYCDHWGGDFNLSASPRTGIADWEGIRLALLTLPTRCGRVGPGASFGFETSTGGLKVLAILTVGVKEMTLAISVHSNVWVETDDFASPAKYPCQCQSQVLESSCELRGSLACSLMMTMLSSSTIPGRLWKECACAQPRR